MANNSEGKEAARQEFEQSGLHLNYVEDGRCMGGNLVPREELEAWLRTKVEAWANKVHTLDKIAKQYPQSSYASFGMLLQLE